MFDRSIEQTLWGLKQTHFDLISIEQTVYQVRSLARKMDLPRYKLLWKFVEFSGCSRRELLGTFSVCIGLFSKKFTGKLLVRTLDQQVRRFGFSAFYTIEDTEKSFDFESNQVGILFYEKQIRTRLNLRLNLNRPTPKVFESSQFESRCLFSENSIRVKNSRFKNS